MAPAPIACEPWLVPIFASKAADVVHRSPAYDLTAAERSRLARDHRLKAQATARTNGSGRW
jgi:hypothetical protein